MLTKNNFFLIIFLCLVVSLFSQTNTRKWRKTENDSMERALLLYDEANYTMALPIYEKLYTGHPKEEYLKYCYGRCALYRSDKHEVALSLLNEVYEKNKKIENIQLDLARANHFNLKFDEALTLLDQCLESKKVRPEIKKEANQLKLYCINAKQFFANPTNAKIENVGNVINTVNDEYVPVISADESIMIYTYRGTESMGGLENAYQQPDPYGVYYEDVYQSNKENGQWTTPKPIAPINSNSHDAAIALSADGQQLFVYRDNGDDHGDIYVSYFANNAWSVPQKLKGEVNSYSWEGSCSMTADGKQLYFSSERGGGYGGKDIYRATLQPDSTWGQVVNLGDSINTALDDDAPFIHPDGINLFYSSKGKNSMGGYDIFQARLNILDSAFHQPVNLGYPINTPDDDIYYVLSANGERGYYASGKQGGYGLKDIYTVYPGYVGKKPSVYIVKGKITAELQPVESNISVEITSKNNKKFGEFKSNSLTGSYLISLPAGGIFNVTYKYDKFPYKLLEVNTMNLEGYDEKLFDIDFNMKDTAKPVAALPPKDTVVAVVVKKEEVKEPVVKKEVVKEPIVKKEESKQVVVKKEELPIEKQPVIIVRKKDGFVPRNAAQEKNRVYSELYGDISAEGLEFKVQIAAYKYPKNYVYLHLKGLGAIENLILNDGITRITIGGAFNTLGKAYERCKKVIIAGQNDAFVTVIYKGKRIYLEDLETMGIYVKK
jgi:Tol biopolymer transport system component